MGNWGYPCRRSPILISFSLLTGRRDCGARCSRDFPILPSDHRRAGYVESLTRQQWWRGWGFGHYQHKCSPSIFLGLSSLLCAPYTSATSWLISSKTKRAIFSWDLCRGDRLSSRRFMAFKQPLVSHLNLLRKLTLSVQVAVVQRSTQLAKTRMRIYFFQPWESGYKFHFGLLVMKSVPDLLRRLYRQGRRRRSSRGCGTFRVDDTANGVQCQHKYYRGFNGFLVLRKGSSCYI